MASDFRQEFIRFTIEQNVLRFGEFKTKAGRLSPYFFDAGLFYDGAALKQLAQFYAKAILAAGIGFDMLFGPAYKGIPLVAAVSIALADAGRNMRYSFNRKEAKDHGEGGTVIGAPLIGQGADRGRRDLGRHFGARVCQPDPGLERYTLRGGDRARPHGARQRGAVRGAGSAGKL